MKLFSSILSLFLRGVFAFTGLHAQPVNNVTFGSTVGVWSGHTTVRERVDSGVNERIELWNRTWTVSPSGQVYENTDRWGFGAPDGYAPTTVTFNELGRWSYWASDGGSVDSWVYGDAPSDWYIWPHNPPNGAGYGGWGRRITAFIDVAPATTYTLTTSVTGSGSVSGGGNYGGGSTATVTATPGNGFAFTGWQGALSGSSNPATLTMDTDKSVTAVFTATNNAPTITWTSAPSSAGSSQNYTVTAHGHDADGNLTQVNVWKAGVGFAYVGGGNGTDSDSGNTTSDVGPASVTFTAQAVDSVGASSATITHTVTIAAANTAPTIGWNTTPGTVASGQSYTISAHGHDADGNLTEVNVWRNGSAYAFAGGGNGTDNDSGNPSSDTGPTTVTYTADAVDANGVRSGTISQTVTISAPPSVTASISATPTSATAPGGTTISWSTTNATAVSVSGNGVSSSATSGSQAINGLPAGIYTYTITAQGSGGPTTQTTTLTVNPLANSAPTIVWNTTPGTVASGQSYTISAHGHDADGNLTEINVWRNGSAFAFAGGGNGTDNDSGNPSSDTGPTTVAYTADAVDANGVRSGTISQTVTISAPPSVTASISASPTSATAPGATTISWSTTNATAVSVSGNGISSSATSGSQAVSGLPAGTYTYTITAQGSGGPVTQTATFTVNAVTSVSASISASPTSTTPPGTATISWTSANATSVSVSGSGLSSTTANGSQTVSGLSVGIYTYTITAQGPNGPAAQTATVTVTAAPNSAPTIAWNTAPGSVASGQSYTISAHGHDADGNLTNVNVYRDGVAYAFAGGGNGTDNDSGNPSTDTGPLTITYTADSVDANGVRSGIISQTVTVSAPAAVTASIGASPTSMVAPGSTTVTWSSANATTASVTGNGINSTATSGSQAVNGLPVGTYTYTITAQGPSGPITQSATFTVNAVASVSASISASPTSTTAPGAATISWSNANATSVSVSGPGLSSASASGSQTVSGLAAGSYTYTIVAQGPNGPATQTATVTVAAAPNSAPTIAWNTVPGTVASGQSYTISAHGHDADGNLTNVNVWRNGVAYAFAGGGNGSDNDAGNPSNDTGPLTITYTAEAIDAAGVHSATISQTVTITAPPSVTGSISASPTTTTAPGSATISWSTSNATAVSVAGNGLSSAAASGSQIVSGLAAGSYTYTLTAQGAGGPITQTATVTVSTGANVSGSISVSPGSMAWGGTATLTWTTANATSVKVSGYGITGSPYQNTPSLTVSVGGLSPGQTTWTLIADGAGGPITRTATINVTTSDGLYGSITTSPTVIYSNQTATLNWTTTGAGFRWVHGYQPGINGVNIYPAAVSGSTTVSSLPPGDYRFTIEYGPGSSTTRMSFTDLTVLGVNRTVAASVLPVGTGSVTGAGTYAEGSSATLTATPAAMHMFAGWSGDLSSAANPLTFTVGAQNYNVVANFALRTYAVTASVSPVGTGSVTGAGNYTTGATATLSATPDATHVFTGWSGDLSGSANPVSFVVNTATNVTANFVAARFVLTTAANTGGTVTPGGTYPAGTVVTITATPDSTHRFINWTGDASGTAATTAVTLDRAKLVQANFSAKTAQTITFDPPGDHGLTSPPFALTASATSGLPVSFSLLGGPAILTGSSVEVTGAGPVTLQANQPGDAFFLPAAPVNQTFNVIAAASLKYRGQSRTLLRDETTRAAPPFVLEKP